MPAVQYPFFSSSLEMLIYAIFIDQGSVNRRAEAKSDPVAVESIRNSNIIVHKLSFIGTEPLPSVECGLANPKLLACSPLQKSFLTLPPPERLKISSKA